MRYSQRNRSRHRFQPRTITTDRRASRSIPTLPYRFVRGRLAAGLQNTRLRGPARKPWPASAFQLVNARYEKGAMILTSNCGFAQWGEIFGDPVVATALLDRLLHHAIVIQIEGSSYRLREHSDLIPQHVRTNAEIMPPPLPR